MREAGPSGERAPVGSGEEVVVQKTQELEDIRMPVILK